MDQVDFFKIYNPRGGAIGIDGSVYFKGYGGRQMGHGIGGIFGAIGRRLLPFFADTSARWYYLVVIKMHTGCNFNVFVMGFYYSIG